MTAWQLSDRADPAARPLADRHYNRQKIGAPQFVPPGRCLVLRTPAADALWITSWPFAEYVRHAWAGAWICSAFRNESDHLSSDLIREAVAATRAEWPDVPPLGMVTFVDSGKVRHKRDPGRCFRRAGFVHVGYTGKGLYALRLSPDAMPDAAHVIGQRRELWPADVDSIEVSACGRASEAGQSVGGAAPDSPVALALLAAASNVVPLAATAGK